jgi:hypothetical protein
MLSAITKPDVHFIKGNQQSHICQSLFLMPDAFSFNSHFLFKMTVCVIIRLIKSRWSIVVPEVNTQCFHPGTDHHQWSDMCVYDCWRIRHLNAPSQQQQQDNYGGWLLLIQLVVIRSKSTHRLSHLTRYIHMYPAGFLHQFDHTVCVNIWLMKGWKQIWKSQKYKYRIPICIIRVIIDSKMCFYYDTIQFEDPVRRRCPLTTLDGDVDPAGWWHFRNGETFNRGNDIAK